MTMVIKLGAESGQARHPKRRMGLLRGTKVSLDAEVDVHIAAFEPAAATTGQFRWFWHFGQPENVCIKYPSGILAAGWHGKLDVIKSDDGHAIF